VRRGSARRGEARNFSQIKKGQQIVSKITDYCVFDGVIYCTEAGEFRLAKNGMFDGLDGFRIRVLSETELAEMIAHIGTRRASPPEPELGRLSVN